MVVIATGNLEVSFLLQAAAGWGPCVHISHSLLENLICFRDEVSVTGGSSGDVLI